MAAMHSAFVVDKATVFYNLDYHDMAPPAYVKMYPDVDRLVLALADMSESVKSSSWGLPEPKRRHMGAFQVPEYPLDNSPMLLSQISHKPANNSDCVPVV